jgi:transcriptional regulator with XRE-family HTH domain
MALGKNIRRLREAQGMSQGELAAKAGGGISQGIITALETRDTTSSKHVVRIAAALGVSVLDLMAGDGTPPTPTPTPPTPALTPQQEELLKLFDGLTERQRKKELVSIRTQKQLNDVLLAELKKRCGQ